MSCCPNTRIGMKIIKLLVNIYTKDERIEDNVFFLLI